MSLRGFTDLDESTAPPAAARLLEATRRHLGFVPTAMRRMAHVPALATAFQAAIGTFDRTSLTAREREVVILTMARIVGCEVCVAMHRGMLAARGDVALANALAEGSALGDARLEALAAFVASALQRHGDVSPDVWTAFLDAGFTRAQALEVVLGLGAYTMSTFANRLTEAPLDAPA